MLCWADHIRCARLGEDLVLLDLQADAYLCLRGAAEAVPLVDGRLVPASPELAAELLASGLAREGAAVPDPAWLPPPAVADLCRTSARPRLRDLARLALSLLDLALAYRGRPLPQVLSAVGWPGKAPAAEVDAELERLVAVYQGLAVWLPAPRKCLARSFLLLRFLQRSGRSAAWVFGVATWPFAAHCWLQAGELLLDETPDRIARYQPILAV